MYSAQTHAEEYAIKIIKQSSTFYMTIWKHKLWLKEKNVLIG